jgi:hypothetical protein
MQMDRPFAVAVVQVQRLTVSMQHADPLGNPREAEWFVVPALRRRHDFPQLDIYAGPTDAVVRP